MTTFDLRPETGSGPQEENSQIGTSTPISVIVPVRNGSSHLPRCLEALGRSEYVDFEVIVVDDCSTDATPQIAERYGARYVRTPQKMGPGGARNLGARHAGGGILAFVDADVVLPPKGLSLIAEDFRHDPELAAVFGSYDNEPAWTSFISLYKNLMHHYVHQTSSERATTFWAGCGAIRQPVFEQFGGFNGVKYTAPSIEDIALGLELSRSGRSVRLDKRLQVKHLKRWTFRSVLRADIFYRAVPWTNLILNAQRLPRDLNLNYASRASSLLVGLLACACILLPFTFGGLIRLRSLPLLFSVAVICLLLLVLNRDIYRFFLHQRGWSFAARAVLAHWFYYFYSGATFFVCSVIHFARWPFSSARKVTAKNRQE